jgi:uncharacterized circularly permuted ATP-grasp superfamily protein/uncharacterized alpha-E superfamily protein
MNETNVAEDSTATSSAARSAPQQFRALLDRYRGVGGCFDEAVGPDGTLRPGWQTLFGKLGGLTVAEVERRVAQAQRQMSIDGVAFNPHDASNVSRPWSLDPIPLVIRQQEWAQVEQGLDQRGRLADLILLDLLGPQTLLHERVLPPEVLFAHPRYFPAYHSLVPRPHKHLQLYAADLARASDGSWWVTSDRTRSPFGLGYVLENRLITSRMLPAAFESCHVRRLAPFFMALQATMKSLSNQRSENPRIAFWSKGPSSRAYFEDAFLARYLGYTLVEGGDLAVRDNKVMLKTLGGLLPVEVLMRRVEDHDCDPAELVGESTNGVAGLLEAIRSGNVAVSNSIGSCLSESPMLLAFLPAVCQHLMGEKLKLPSIGTWWCGQESALRYVLDNFDNLVIRYAFRRDDEAPFQPSKMTAEQKAELKARIKAAPGQFVGQSRISRSTAPVWEGGQIHSWSLALRSFLVSNGDRYETLPGGLARVAPEADVLLHNMTSGEKSQDVWILSDERVEAVSLLNVNHSTIELTRGGAELPSRAADNLFWLGRNLERAEQIARLVRVTLQHITSQEDAHESLAPLIAACRRSKQLPAEASELQLTQSVEYFSKRITEGILDRKSSFSLRSVVHAAEATAMKVRDRIALDHLRVIGDLRLLLDTQLASGEVAASDLISVLDNAIIQLNALSGLAGENMTRTLGWRFLDMGRRLERAFQTASTLGQLLPLDLTHVDVSRSLEFCLQIHDSFMTYRNRYLANLQIAAVLDLLIADDTNPRSIMFQMHTVSKHVDRLPRSSTQAILSNEERLALSITNAVRLAEIAELSTLDKRGELTGLHKLLSRLIEQLPKLSDAVSARFLIHAGFQRHFAISPASTRQSSSDNQDGELR